MKRKIKSKVYKGKCKYCGRETKSIRKIEIICYNCDIKLHPEDFAEIPGLRI